MEHLNVPMVSRTSGIASAQPARLAMARAQQPMPAFFSREADLRIPNELWAPKETGRPRCLRRKLMATELAAIEARRAELEPWVAPFFGGEEQDRVSDAIMGMYDAFPHMASKSEESAILRTEQLLKHLADFPAWAIEKCLNRIAVRGYTRKEGDKYVQERHWAPSDPEIVAIVEDEIKGFVRAHASAVAILGAEVEGGFYNDER
jgi:hypothetical protein